MTKKQSFDIAEFINWARKPKNHERILKRVLGLLTGGYFDTPEQILETLQASKKTGKNEVYVRVAHQCKISLESEKYLRKGKSLGLKLCFNDAEVEEFHGMWNEAIEKRKAQQSEQRPKKRPSAIEARMFLRELKVKEKIQEENEKMLVITSASEARTFTD